MADQKPALVSLSLTNVHYDPTDPFAPLLAILTLAPQALILTYVVLLLTHREVEIALTFAGQLACEALNWALKRWFKEARPERIRDVHGGYGMPSSHAQFVWYFAVTVGLFVGLRHVPGGTWVREREERRLRDLGVGNEDGGASMNGTAQDVAGLPSPLPPSQMYALQSSHPRLTHTFLAVTAAIFAALVSASRIYLHYHTPRQVLVGCLAGTFFAFFWFGVTEALRWSGVVEWGLETRLGRAARVRDLVCEEDLVEIGWRVWEEKRRRRRLMQEEAERKRSQ